MQRFSEAVRTNKCTLASVVRATSTWEHLWTMWTPDNGAGSSKGAAAAPDDRKLQDEVERLRKFASSLQSEKDRAIAQAEAMRRQVQNGTGGGKGNGGVMRTDNGGNGKGNGGSGNGGNNGNNNGKGSGGGKFNGSASKRQRGR